MILNDARHLIHVLLVSNELNPVQITARSLQVRLHVVVRLAKVRDLIKQHFSDHTNVCCLTVLAELIVLLLVALVLLKREMRRRVHDSIVKQDWVAALRGVDVTQVPRLAEAEKLHSAWNGAQDFFGLFLGLFLWHDALVDG